MTSYKVTFAHTPAVTHHESYEDALTAVRAVFRDASLCDDNSEVTLVWADDDARDRDLDGSRTVARIRVVRATD